MRFFDSSANVLGSRVGARVVYATAGRPADGSQRGTREARPNFNRDEDRPVRSHRGWKDMLYAHVGVGSLRTGGRCIYGGALARQSAAGAGMPLQRTVAR
mmetsp:Transcript_12360/g.17064  ORF Transcript_12360/g.17064 Transcript_12360/m.17064 type:complete len:100 (-) Transcript_12360:479-778(-)